MPVIAGVFENRCCPFQVSGSHQRITADGVTLVVLEHQHPNVDAESLLRAYRKSGVRALHERAADCTLVLFDVVAQQLVLSRDAVGVHPCYYRETPTKFAFATFVADVIRACGTPNPARSALAARLVHGRSPAPGETYFNDVHSVPPGCTLVMADGRTSLLRTAPPQLHPNGTITFEDAAAEFARLFERAVAARLDATSKTAVLVSGGLDSAAIISCTNPSNALGITYGLTDGSLADERECVAALRAHGHHIESVEFYPSSDIASVERSVQALEQPVADDVPATLERAAHAARQGGAAVLMLGTWGDQVLSPFPPPYMRQVAPWHFRAHQRAATAYQRYMADLPQNEVLRALLRASLRARIPQPVLRRMRARRRHSSVFDVLAREFNAPEPAPPPQTYGAAVHQAVSDAEHCAALEASTKWGLANGLEVRLPFLDVSLLKWLRTVPDDVAYHNFELKPLLRTGLRDKLPAEIVHRRNKGDYTQAIASGRVPTLQVLDALDGLRRFVDFGLMSTASARATLAKLSKTSNIADNTRDLASNLLAVDAWLRQFFEAR